jgi:hypothetical protein
MLPFQAVSKFISIMSLYLHIYIHDKRRISVSRNAQYTIQYPIELLIQICPLLFKLKASMHPNLLSRQFNKTIYRYYNNMRYSKQIHVKKIDFVRPRIHLFEVDIRIWQQKLLYSLGFYPLGEPTGDVLIWLI